MTDHSKMHGAFKVSVKHNFPRVGNVRGYNWKVKAINMDSVTSRRNMETLVYPIIKAFYFYSLKIQGVFYLYKGRKQT